MLKLPTSQTTTNTNAVNDSAAKRWRQLPALRRQPAGAIVSFKPVSSVKDQDSSGDPQDDARHAHGQHAGR